MSNILRKSGPLFVALLMVMSLACGDEDDENIALNQGTGGGGAANSDDCPDEMSYNPVTGECTDPGQSNGGNSTTNGGNSTSNDNTSPGNQTSNQNAGNNANNSNGFDGECGPGRIIGQSCRPNGQVLAGALVTVTGDDCDGNEFSVDTVADQDGEYEFNDVPAGNHTIRVESGSFSEEQPVTVYKDQETNLLSESAKVCIGGDSVPIAVIQGTYDDVGSILSGMDIEYEVVGSDGTGGLFPGESSEAEEFLLDVNQMMQYDILFIECGNLWTNLSMGDDILDPSGGEVDQAILDNLRSYVESGRSLYVSDLAQAFIQMSLPEAVDFLNDSEGPDGPRKGNAQDVTADVVSADMQAALGPGTTEITYSLGSWSVAEGGGSASTVHFEADVGTSQGTVVDSALMVSYDDPVGGGKAIFTSFHNTDQPTGDMEDILEFMVFQL